MSGSFIDDFKNEDIPSSHEIVEKAAESVEPKRKGKPLQKPRFSVNLTDDDFERLQVYCDQIGMSYAALARTLLLKEISKAE